MVLQTTDYRYNLVRSTSTLKECILYHGMAQVLGTGINYIQYICQGGPAKSGFVS
jgi:hypothetical protein